MKRILSLWLAALMFAAQTGQAAVCVGFGQSASADPGFIQAKSVYSRTASITLDTAVTGGNQLIALYLSHSNIDTTGASISGGCATSWTAKTQYYPGSGAYYAKVFICTNASSGSNAVTPSGWTSGDAAWYLIEAENVSDVSDSAMAVTSGSPASSGDATAGGSALIIGAYDTANSPSTVSATNYTLASSQTGHRSWVFYREVSASGDYAFSATLGVSVAGAALAIILE